MDNDVSLGLFRFPVFVLGSGAAPSTPRKSLFLKYSHGGFSAQRWFLSPVARQRLRNHVDKSGDYRSLKIGERSCVGGKTVHVCSYSVSDQEVLEVGKRTWVTVTRTRQEETRRIMKE